MQRVSRNNMEYTSLTWDETIVPAGHNSRRLSTWYNFHRKSGKDDLSSFQRALAAK